jgi:hypothetical protein
VSRGAKVEITCACGTKFMARIADRKRGWGKFCSKSCKASVQESRTGQYRNYRNSGVDRKTYLHYAREHGGLPNFDSNGKYVGFQCGGFSQEDHDIWSGGKD